MAGFVEVAKTSEVPVNTLKQVRVNGTTVCIANINGTFRAIHDRCGHMNAPLHMGTLKDGNVVCPQHFAIYDLATGAVMSGPNAGGGALQALVKYLPPEALRQVEQNMARSREIMSKVETLPLKVYEVKVEGDKLLLKVE
jgi:nitrite reductase/ring-hydroxylating ferredoxin subunit